MADNEPIPEEAQEPMDNFNVALAEFEQVLDEYISVPVDEQQERCPLEKARAELTTLFAVNSLYWTLQAAGGKEPREDEALAIELSRAKEYMARVEKFDASERRPRINERVAKALVRNALFDVSGGSAAGEEKGADTSTTAQKEPGVSTEEDADDAVEIVNEQPATKSRAPTYASVVAGRGTSVRRQQPKRTVFASPADSSPSSTSSDESGGEGDARDDKNEEPDLMVIDTKGVKGSSMFASAKRKRADGKCLLRSSKAAPTKAVIDISDDDDDDDDDDGETAKKRTRTAGGGRK